MRPSLISDKEESFGLWYELGGLYARAGEDVRRAVREGFVAVFVAAALVLVSALFFGTFWAGPFAAVILVVAGCSPAAALSGGGASGSLDDAKLCAERSRRGARTPGDPRRRASSPTTTRS